MAGVDVCQKLSGVTLKLLAFERLLTEYPNHRDEVRLPKSNPENSPESSSYLDAGTWFAAIPLPCHTCRHSRHLRF